MIPLPGLLFLLVALCGIAYASVGVVPGQYQVFLQTSNGNTTSDRFILFANTSTLVVTYPGTTIVTSSIFNHSFFVSWTPSSPNSSVPVMINLARMNVTIPLGSVPNLGKATFDLSTLTPSLHPSSGWSVVVSSSIYGTNASGPVVNFISPPSGIVVTVPPSGMINSSINVTWVPFDPFFGPGIALLSIVDPSISHIVHSVNETDLGTYSLFLDGSILTAPKNYTITVTSAYGNGTAGPILVLPVQPPTPPVSIVATTGTAVRTGQLDTIEYMIANGTQVSSLSFRLVSFNRFTTVFWTAPTISAGIARVSVITPSSFPKGTAAIYTVLNGVTLPTPMIVTII